MREILFRGKRIDNGEWVYGDLVHSVYKLEDVCVGQYGNEVGMHQVHEETVGQHTGTDKNGKKIFEGDLCLCNRNINSFVDNQVFLISFDTEYGQWVGSSRSSNIAADEFSLCEVIGNIHDNPELLEEG